MERSPYSETALRRLGGPDGEDSATKTHRCDPKVVQVCMDLLNTDHQLSHISRRQPTSANLRHPKDPHMHRPLLFCCDFASPLLCTTVSLQKMQPLCLGHRLCFEQISLSSGRLRGNASTVSSPSKIWIDYHFEISSPASSSLCSV